MAKQQRVFWGLFIIGFAFLLGYGPLEAEPAKPEEIKLTEKQQLKLDPFLRQLVAHPGLKPTAFKGVLSSTQSTAQGEALYNILLKSGAGRAALAPIKGLILEGNIGNIYSAKATAQALVALTQRGDTFFIESAHQLHLLNDVASTNAAGMDGTISDCSRPQTQSISINTVGTYTFQALRDPNSSLNPYLQLCQDSACTTVLAFNDNDIDNPYDSTTGKGTLNSRIDYTFSVPGTYFLRIADATFFSFLQLGCLLGGGSGNYKLVMSGPPPVPGGNYFLGTGARELHAQGIEGQGVIVGIIDTGIDWCHPDFQDPVTGNTTRVKFLWDQTLTPCNGNTPCSTEKSPCKEVDKDGKCTQYYDGVEYSDTQINAAIQAGDCTKTDPNSRSVREADTEGHGTHVAGISAGNGSASSGRYQGAAPKADIIFVRMGNGNSIPPNLPSTDNFMSTNILNGLSYILEKEKDLNEPVVINMSLGEQLGPHDGTDLLSQAILQATGPGKLIVVSAGNDGHSPIHAQATISPNSSIELSTTISEDNKVVEVWYDKGDAYNLTLSDGNGGLLSALSGQSNIQGTFNNVSVEIDNPGLSCTDSPLLSPSPLGDSASINPNNKCILINFISGVTSPTQWSITLSRVSSSNGSGQVHAYIGPICNGCSSGFSKEYLPVIRKIDGSIDAVTGTVGEPATSKGAIAVGSYNSKFTWIDVNGNEQFENKGFKTFQDFGNISLFSSRGPTRDGRVKPDITAPGARIVSVKSQDAMVGTPDFPSTADVVSGDPSCQNDCQYGLMQGTSQAAPAVTGALALALQLDPTLFPHGQLRFLYQDQKTGSISSTGSNTWGYGKINVSLLKAQLQADHVPTVTLSADTISGFAPLTAHFTAIASDPDSGDYITSYLWRRCTNTSVPNVDWCKGETVDITSTPTYSLTFPGSGTYTYQVIASDSWGKIASSNTVTITINAVPQLSITTTSPLPPWTFNLAYQTSIQTLGGALPLTFSVTQGALPQGLTLDPNTGFISGTPTQVGTFNFTVTVTDFASIPQSISQSFSLTINALPLQITTLALSNGIVGTSYSTTLEATGGVAPYSWSVTSGTLPNGLALNATTGVLSGTPLLANAFTFAIQVTDSVSATATQTFSVAINNPLSITTKNSLSNGQVSSFYKTTLVGFGGAPPYSWSLIAGTLPSGITLNTSTGVLSGVPTQAGSSSFTVQLEDTLGLTASQAYTLTINPIPPSPLVIAPSTLFPAQLNTAYSVTLQASGGVSPYTWSLLGTPPNGLVINAGTGVLSWSTPLWGTFSIQIQVTDSQSPPAMTSQTFSLMVASNPLLLFAGTGNFQKQGVDPIQGPGSTSFTFKVQYLDANNIAPSAVQVGIDFNQNGVFGEDEKFSLQAENPSNTTFSDGKIYTLTKTINFSGAKDPLVLNYRFFAQSLDGRVAQGDASAVETLKIFNNRPLLQFVADTGAFSNGADPVSLNTGQPVSFKVRYTDKDNQSPALIRVRVQAGSVQTVLPLQRLSGQGTDFDGDFTNGEVYGATASFEALNGLPTVYTFSFQASDGTLFDLKRITSQEVDPLDSGLVTLDIPQVMAFTVLPLSTNHNPILSFTNESGFTDTAVSSNGIPQLGNACGNTFSFHILYTDADNDPPTLSQLWLDLNNDGKFYRGERFDLTQGEGSDFSKGVIYSFRLKLYSPTIPYQFTFSDGHSMVTFKDTLTITGCVDSNGDGIPDVLEGLTNLIPRKPSL